MQVESTQGLEDVAIYLPITQLGCYFLVRKSVYSGSQVLFKGALMSLSQ